jgi:hypothetical protein
MSSHTHTHTRRRVRRATVSAGDFLVWRTRLVRSGGRVVMSCPVVGGFLVDYTTGGAR